MRLPCRCSNGSGTCLTQFANKAQDLEELRSAFRALDRIDQELQLSCMLHPSAVPLDILARRRLTVSDHEGSAAVDSDAGAAASSADSLGRISSADDGQGTHARSSAIRRKPRQKAYTAILLDKPVCQRALPRLLGIGSSRVSRVCAGIFARPTTHYASTRPSTGLTMRAGTRVHFCACVFMDGLPVHRGRPAVTSRVVQAQSRLLRYRGRG